MIRVATAALLQVPLVGAASQWVYAYSGELVASGTAQEATWGGLCTTGKEQSPINVVSGVAVKTSMPVITTHIDTEALYVKKTGHGFQLFETSPKGHTLDSAGSPAATADVHPAKGYSMISGDKFNFYQIHWHTPSENTIDGASFGMEAHFVVISPFRSAGRR